MRKLIRWLARISGEESKIRRHQQKIDAGMLRDTTYYFGAFPRVFNALFYCADCLEKYGILLPDEIREMVYLHGDKKWMDEEKKIEPTNIIHKIKVEIDKELLVELYDFAFEQAKKTNTINRLHDIDHRINSKL